MCFWKLGLCGIDKLYHLIHIIIEIAGPNEPSVTLKFNSHLQNLNSHRKVVNHMPSEESNHSTSSSSISNYISPNYISKSHLVTLIYIQFI